MAERLCKLSESESRKGFVWEHGGVGGAYGVVSGCAKGLFLALCSEVTLDGAAGTISSTGAAVCKEST